MMAAKPDAFLSYTRFDDRRGKISEFRTWLSDAVEEVSGHPFDIFQDIEGIGLGKKWQGVLDEMLDQARFFIPILTPKFFNSGPCRDELTKFLELERATGRQDLVLPVYWITCPALEEGHLKAEDELAQTIDERQRRDWRKLRHLSFVDPEVSQQLEVLGSEIDRARRNVLRVIETPKEVVALSKARPKTPPPELKTVPPQSKSSPSPPSQQRNPPEAFKDIDALWCPEMVQLPAGKFLMGSPETEKSRSPQHEVTISQPFTLGRYAVTFEEYDHFCDETARKKSDDRGWGRGRRPVIKVSHGDAEAYCAWLSEVTGKHYHLPSEAQWEYACRSGTSTAYAFGDELTKAQAHFGQGERGQTVDVGLYPANAWGLHDMHGNVLEWCADHWHKNYEGAPDDGSAWLSPPSGDRVMRGGSWFYDAQIARSAYRSHGDLESRLGRIGFRCARAADRAGPRLWIGEVDFF